MKKFNQNEGYDSDDEELKLWENMPTKGNELRACTPTTAVALSKQTPVVAEPLPDKHATSLIEHFIYGVDATTYCVGALAHAMLRLTAIVLSCLVSVIKAATPVVTSVVWCVLCFMARMCFYIIRAPRFHDMIAYFMYVVAFIAAIMGCYEVGYEVARRNGFRPCRFGDGSMRNCICELRGYEFWKGGMVGDYGRSSYCTTAHASVIDYTKSEPCGSGTITAREFRAKTNLIYYKDFWNRFGRTDVGMYSWDITCILFGKHK